MENKMRAQHIKMLVLDVDGVLTNGEIIFNRDGDAYKIFNAQDGLGITVAQRAGLRIGIITGRQSDMVRLRAMELKIPDIYQGSVDKVHALDELCGKYQLSLQEVAYMGDDLNDLAVLRRVGLACAPANASVDVKRHVHYMAAREGGRGAVREVIEYILHSQNKWDNIVNDYLVAGQDNRQ